jgi:spermidine/putrescine transport system permease protein
MKNQKRWGLFFFLSPVLLWLVLLIVLPQIDLLVMSFRLENDEGRMIWSLSNYLNFFEEPIYWLTFVRTAIYSILVTFLTFAVALPVAFYITKVVAPKFQGFLLVLLLLPFWVSELVRVYGWMILLRESGFHHDIRAGLHLHAFYGGSDCFRTGEPGQQPCGGRL